MQTNPLPTGRGHVPGEVEAHALLLPGLFAGNELLDRAADGERNWDGYLDEIAIFSVELTEDQVLDLYEQAATINPLNVLE